MGRHGESANSRNPQGPSDDDGRGVFDEALEPEQMRTLNASLRQVADLPGASPELKEMAKKLLSGHVTLRDILDDPSGSRVFSGDLGSLRSQWESASDEERDRLRNGETIDGSGSGGPSDSAEQRRPQDEEQRPKKKNQGRHSGGFSLY